MKEETKVIPTTTWAKRGTAITTPKKAAIVKSDGDDDD